MPVLRSREIPSPPPPPPPNLTSFKSKTLKKGFIEPSTPSKSTEPLLNQSPHEAAPRCNSAGLGSDSAPISRRRSLRLASKSTSPQIEVDCPSFRRKRRRNVDVEEEDGSGKCQFQLKLDVNVQNVNDFDSLDDVDSLGFGENGARVFDSREERVVDGVAVEVKECTKRGRRRSELEGIEVKQVNGVLSLRSGTRIVKRSAENVLVMEDEAEVQDVKGKAVLVERGTVEDESASEMKLEDDVLTFDSTKKELKNARRFTREEKGKDKVIEDGVILNAEELDMLRLKLGLNYSRGDLNPLANAYENTKYGGPVDNGASYIAEDGIPVHVSSFKENAGQKLSIMDRFKDIARRNASRFAHFDAREEDESHVDSEAGTEEPIEQPAENVEDWPGPFSTAMKIIRDRENNMGGQVQNLDSGKVGMPLVSWTPRKDRDNQWPKRAAPSLQDLCLSVLAKNVDAITSLTYVPDVLRHKLTQMLCDSRRMNGHFLDLLLEGSPLEIRLPDCSWLEEDKFEKSFEGCCTNNLTVLQLDLCGHCLSDSSLLKALVPKGLPSLTMVSLKGACRISDVGLSALVSSAPALRSMNLSQCSLLTHVGISNLANSLGSILRELYLDDCESLDAMHILPGLKKLRCLEVLSLRGIGSVSDKFMKQLIISNGQNMKELVVANCVKLTDSSLKVIAETCSQLCVLDLSHLTKLTDIGMVHLANGCRRIEDLTLCRNSFSDDAIAAFLEVSGESLKELSLNNIAKVGQNTTISLSRHGKNLQSLDLSWCRNLTDETLGLIADSCLALRVLKLFGCTQVTRTFLDGHSNPHLQIIGLKLTPILSHIKRPHFQQGPLLYSAVPSF